MKRFFIILTCVLFFFTACTSMGTIITEDSHTVVIDSSVSGGKLSVSSSTFQVGDTVAVTVTPNEGMKLKDGSLMYKFGNDSIPIRRNSFFMPSGQVQLTAEFIPENNTEIILKTLPRDSVIFMGSVTLDFQIKSRVDDISVEWHLENPDMAEIIPMDEYGTRIALKQLQHGSTNLVGHSGDGAQKVVEITILDNILTYQNNGVITGPTPKFHGGELIIPDFVNGVPVTGIKEKAFADRGITAVRLPESLVYVEAEAFVGNKIVSIEIPSSVEAVGLDAFSNCGLTTIYCSSAMADKTWLGINAFGESVEQIIVMDGTVSPFRTTVNWNEYLGFITGMDSKAIVTRQISGGSLVFKCDGVETTYASPEEIVNIDIIPEEGWQYIAESVTVKDELSSSVEVRTSEDGLLYFTMPDSIVSVTAEFEKVSLSYSVQHRGPVAENSNVIDYGKAGAWGNVSMKLADDLSKLTITPIPNPGYKLAGVSVVNSETFHTYTDITQESNIFVVTLEQGTFTAHSTLSIIAIWDAVIVDILFKDIGGEKTVHTTKVRYSGDLKDATFPAIPIKEGYEFSGYYTAPNGSGECFIDNEMKAVVTKFTPGTYSSETNSVNLYPGFTPKTYKLTLLLGSPKNVMNDKQFERTYPKADTVIYQLTVTYGKPIPSIHSDFSVYRNEYPLDDFAGFYGHGKQYFDRNGTPLISNWDIPTDTVLEGVWNPKKVTLKFHYDSRSDDGSFYKPEILNSLSMVGTPGQKLPTVNLTEIPHRRGHILDCITMTVVYPDTGRVGQKAAYKLEGSSLVPDRGLSHSVTGDLVHYGLSTVNLYAVWRPRTVRLNFHYAENLEGNRPLPDGNKHLPDGTDIDEGREIVEPLADVWDPYIGEYVKEFQIQEHTVKVNDALPADIKAYVSKIPVRICHRFTGFYDSEGRRYYDENLELDEKSIAGGKMPLVDVDNVKLFAGWELDGVEIKSSNANSYKSGTLAAGTSYHFTENVSITGNNNNYGIAIGGTPDNPTNLYIPKGVTVTIKAGERNVNRYSRQSGKSSNYLYSYVTGLSSSSSLGPAPGVEMYCAVSDGERSSWRTLGDPFAGGAPGIYVPSGNCLRVFGEGTLYAAGSDGIDAYDACNSPRKNADTDGVSASAHKEKRAYGAAGGAGASGGGAGIGGYGGSGAPFNPVPYYTSSHKGPSGSPGEQAGHLYFYGNMKINVRGGNGGRSGKDSSYGNGREISSHDDHSGAGGGGGGGYGGGGAGVGGGGGGGGAGGYGGNGIVDNEKDGESGSNNNGSYGSMGSGHSYWRIADLPFYAYPGQAGGDGGNGGGVTNKSPAACWGGDGGNGGSGGKYDTVFYDNRVKFNIWEK